MIALYGHSPGIRLATFYALAPMITRLSFGHAIDQEI